MAGRYSDSFLEQVRAANDIVDVIGASLKLKRAGANFLALCPFHREKTPSFNISPQRQIFHCFGCHKGGDVFKFIREYENVDFGEAVRRLAERAGIPLEHEQGAGQSQARELKETLRSIHEQIAQRWQKILASDPTAQIARDYLARRQVNPEAVRLFRLGYAPDAWDDTVNWARTQKLDLAVVEQAGLILRKEEAANYYDRFRGRLIFPIGDEQGRVVAFSGRILADDVKTAKYVNSPETPIFSKRKTFYGLDKSKRSILDAQYAVICEGQLDLIACYMSGVKNIVAPQGTAFTADHARILKRFVNEVVLCFDSDNAGQSAAVRVLDELLASGLAIRVALVPAPHDPDSFIKENGGPAFQRLIEKAQGFFDFYLDYLCQKNDPRSDRGRTLVVKEMGEALQKTGSAVLLDTHAQKTALRLGVNASAVRAEFAKLKPGGGSAVETALEEEAKPAATRPPPKEYWLLKYLYLPECEMAWLEAHLDVDWLEHPGVKKIVTLCLATWREGRGNDATAILDRLADDEATRNLLTEVLADQRPIPNPQQQLADVVKWIRNQRLERQLGQITPQLENPDFSDAQRRDLLQQMTALRSEKQKPLAAQITANPQAEQ